MTQRLRETLRQNRWIYGMVTGWRRGMLNRRIRREQRWAETAANSWTKPDAAPARVFARLDEKLKQRGLHWPPSPKGRPLHILYVSHPSNWERHNLPPQLAQLGDVSCFYLEEQGCAGGDSRAVRGKVHESLPRFVANLHRRHPIDFILSYLSGASIRPETIQAMGAVAPVFGFHLDDRLKFHGRHDGEQWSGPAAVCKAYDLNLTNATASLVKYAALGAEALFWPEGANPEFFRPRNLAEEFDVSFCGQRYGVRPIYVDYLRRHGVSVACFGEGWENGYITDERIVEIASASSVSLGFGFVNESSDQCLKGRDFELPACGAVYLTSDNPDLHRVYDVGTEVESYADPADCLRQVRRLLGDSIRRTTLRTSARNAVVQRHSWKSRVADLIACKGVSPT